MISKLDESQSEDTIKGIFDRHDHDSNGELSVEKFGQAIYEALKLMKHEDGEGDGDHE